MILKAQLGDITKFPVDAIVNSAQPSLRRRSGVDAIHEAAGPELQEECLRIETYQYVIPHPGLEDYRCGTAEVYVTKAYRLPAKYVFHTVAPAWNPQGYADRTGQRFDMATLPLSLCYKHCLQKAVELQAKSISFPLISRRFPFQLEKEARIAVLTTLDFPGPEDMEVMFVCLDQKEFDVYSYVISKGFSLVDKITGEIR